MMEILNYPQLLQTFVAHFVLVYYWTGSTFTETNVTWHSNFSVKWLFFQLTTVIFYFEN